MTRITQFSDIQNIKDLNYLKRSLQKHMKNVEEVVNNGLTFDDNFSAKTVSVTFPLANIDYQFPHYLGRIPVGYIKIGSAQAGNVYDGSDPAQYTANTMLLRADVVGTYTLLIF